MNSICLTADQAKEIVENRRLELFSPCEWQLQLHEGKLRWREVWEVVEEQG